MERTSAVGRSRKSGQTGEILHSAELTTRPSATPISLGLSRGAAETQGY
jgi:hypothetical protein